jgi:glutamate carboxypeptidase
VIRLVSVPLVAACLVGAGSRAAAGDLSPLERRLVTRVAAHQDETLALIERAVDINSGTMNFAGVRHVGEVFREPLERLGLTTRWVDGQPFGRAGHLVAERRGRGPHVLLIGHLDTVFEADSPFQRYERVDEHTARGPGVVDMKGGNAIIVAALRALHEVNALDRLTVSVLLTGDEEKAGDPIDLARAELRALADAADIALGFENAANDPRTAVVARRGSTRWRLEVEARPGHSSRIFEPEAGAGAIFELARILTAFREELSGERFLTFNPGLLLGGTTVEVDPAGGRGAAVGKNNVIAARAEAAGDLRTLTAPQLASAKARMQGVVARGLPHATSRIAFTDGYPPLALGAGSARLLVLLDAASRDLGHGSVWPVDPARAGAADISFTAGRVEMALDGLGLLGGGEHAAGEWADLRTLPVQTRRAALLLLRLAGGAATSRDAAALDVDYHDNGQLAVLGARDAAGRLDGRRLAFYPGGEHGEESYWDHGRLLRGTTWTRDGAVHSEVVDGTGSRWTDFRGAEPAGREDHVRGVPGGL